MSLSEPNREDDFREPHGEEDLKTEFNEFEYEDNNGKVWTIVTPKSSLKKLQRDDGEEYIATDTLWESEDTVEPGDDLD